MRICRFEIEGKVRCGYYLDDYVIGLAAAAEAFRRASGMSVELPEGKPLLAYLPPDGEHFRAAATVATWLEAHPHDRLPEKLPINKIKLLVPIPNPAKLFLLAGNYAAHIEEGGGRAAERAETFPYVFMKPPSTTLTHPFDPVVIPAVSPDHIDWELELGVVIGRRAKRVAEAEALDYVAGYTIVNDISDRQFRLNPQRKPREKDPFFDWLHGKWHDTFCPCGPCIRSAHTVSDPQTLKMQLRVNGQLKQNATTGQMIFPVAAVVAFLSQFVTLEPGDIISTGTPSGVGHASGQYLKPGDMIEASIEGIGTLVNPVVAPTA
jgi:2-keto-4-pentenoate hydratase/2-oxohepta-3-ene-1,7-dioic acid hydratase in catechol pathway